MNNRPDEEEEAEEGADAQQGHRHRPPDGLDTARAAHAWNYVLCNNKYRTMFRGFWFNLSLDMDHIQ